MLRFGVIGSGMCAPMQRSSSDVKARTEVEPMKHLYTTEPWSQHSQGASTAAGQRMEHFRQVVLIPRLGMGRRKVSVCMTLQS